MCRGRVRPRPPLKQAPVYDHTNDVPLASSDNVNRADVTRPPHSSGLVAAHPPPVESPGRPTLENMRTPPGITALVRAILDDARAALSRGDVPWDDTPAPTSEPCDEWLSPSECQHRANREAAKRMDP